MCIIPYNNLYKTADNKLFDFGLLLEDHWLSLAAFTHPCQSAPPCCLCLLVCCQCKACNAWEAEKVIIYSFRIEFSALIKYP